MTCYSYGDMLGLCLLIGLLWFSAIFCGLHLLDKCGMLQEDDE
jgi:hypothetical protein